MKMDVAQSKLKYEEFEKKEKEKEMKIKMLRDEVHNEKYRDKPLIDPNSKRMGGNGASTAENVHERLYQIG